MTDAVSGETVDYAYDSLKRLTSAETTGTQWGQSFSYDGFGNLLAQTVTKGSAPSLSVLVSGTTNRITSSGYSYDSNGNLTAAPGLTMTYDVENRMSSATSSSGIEYYAYGPSNERVWKRIEYSGGGSTNFVYFYGVDGALLTTGGIDDDWDYNVYFAGRQVWREWTGFSWSMPPMPVSPDRLGSTVKHFPYGDEPTATAPNREKFATYCRDEATALDYARNRYYSSTIARFTTADPYQASGGPADPQSWNRYAYVQGDPVNFNDPAGLFIEYPGDPLECAYVRTGGIERYAVYPACSWRRTDGSGHIRAYNYRPPVVTAGMEQVYKLFEYSAEAFSLAKEALQKSSCRGLFGNGADPLQVLSGGETGSGSTLTQILYEHLGEDGDIAQTWLQNGVTQPYAWITINLDGAWTTGFEVQRELYGNYTDGQFRAMYLIHELGHVFQGLASLGGFMVPDHPNQSNGDIAYNQEILDACF